MENVVLIIHLILALSLIGTVLLQRSEGGGLGMGGGGGATGSRPAPTAMSKFTWALAAAFICTSIALTLIAASNTAGSSVADRFGADPVQEGVAVPDLGDSLLPPSLNGDDPLLPAGE
ncbi:preprotein translocase subunit SecG [Loktanella sp. PT4BL]|jgi:preprotein translocase subunit SecG|uniref:Protein-export membrane protein SecG n=1 Tax=Yoonia rosea TaxID=287098 RepID=A0A1R3WV66_9RHOB|nr:MULTISPECIES: preprotein translocase subunit SecG [Rhodobacterales]KQB95455.1 preprotein translocase subunit SecG [Loktanella sp. 1ANDIMAR09]PXW67988.1 preprotein translocase subunit SecG [Loktanella sp. PT4BL]SIT81904.1 preprotein translocase subunit SecG [Yoonia rosea]